MSCHPIDRAKERYNVDFQMVDIYNIKDKIKENKAQHIKTTPDGKKDYLLFYKGKEFMVRYDSDMNRLITFLTMNRY